MLSSLAAGVLLLSGALSVEGKTTDYLAKCANELEDDDVLRVAVIGGQACLYFVVGVFYWTRFPDPHLKDARLAVFSMCTSLNGYIMLFSGFMNLIALSQIDDVILEDCTKIDTARALQWTISCPLLTWQISLLARGKRQRQIEVFLSTFFCLLLGLFAQSAPEATYRYLFFSASTVFLGLLVVNLDWAIRETTMNRESIFKGSSHLRKIVLCVAVTWSVFPVLWLIGPLGTGAVRDDAVLIVNTICDICSKLLLTFYVFFVRNQWQKTLQIEEATAKADPTSPRRNDRHMSFVTGNKNTAEENAAARAATLARLEVEKLQSERADLEIGRGSLG